MYIPKHFEETRTDVLHAFIRAHPLATIVVSDRAELAADHIPLTLRAGHGVHGALLGHVARSNPLAQKAAKGIECLVVFQGLQHYISPNWYASKAETGKVVPTWNYEAVHVQGKIHSVDDRDWLRELLTELTAEHEAPQSAPWRLSDAPEDYVARMIGAVIGIRVEIVGMIGKFKLSQNQPAGNRSSLARALQDSGAAPSMEMAGAIEARNRSQG